MAQRPELSPPREWQRHSKCVFARPRWHGRRLSIEPLETRALLAANQVAAFGDFGQNSSNEAAVAALVDSWNVGGIAALGDLNYLSASQIDTAIGKYYHQFIGNYQGSFGAGSTVNKFWPALGNHDYDNDPKLTDYLSYFTLPGNERYYDWTIANAHFFVVNSEPQEPDGNSATSEQAMWLKDALSKSTSTFNIVYEHRPPFSSSSKHGSQDNMQWPYKAWGADLVMSGHVHNYERLVEDGLTYIVSGLGGLSASVGYPTGTGIPGSLVRYNSHAGALRLTFTSTQILGEFYSVESPGGKLIDSFTIAADGNPAPDPPSVAISGASLNEGNAGQTALRFTVALSSASADPVTLHYETVDGSATAGTDYVANSGNLTFAPGQTQKTITVQVLGDPTVENDETFTVDLSAVSGASVATAAAVGTIRNDDQVIASPLDVDGNTRIEGLDVLLVINELLLHGSYTIDHATMGTSRDKFDTSRDGLVSPIDALVIINGIMAPQQFQSLALRPNIPAATRVGNLVPLATSTSWLATDHALVQLDDDQVAIDGANLLVPAALRRRYRR